MGKALGFLIGLTQGPFGPLIGMVLGHFLLDRSGFSHRILSSFKRLIPLPKIRRYPPCPLCRQPMMPIGTGILACARCCARASGPLSQLGTRSATLQAAVMSTLVAIAKSDGPLQRPEVRAIRDFFRFELGVPESELEKIKDLLRETADRSPTVRTSALALAQFLDSVQRRDVVSCCHRLALSDGPLKPVEKKALEILALAFRIEPELDTKDSNRESKSAPPRNPYEVLEIDQQTATPKSIRDAHRKLAILYHPDRVAHLAPEFRTLAEEKFKAIQNARDQLLGR